MSSGITFASAKELVGEYAPSLRDDELRWDRVSYAVHSAISDIMRGQLPDWEALARESGYRNAGFLEKTAASVMVDLSDATDNQALHLRLSSVFTVAVATPEMSAVEAVTFAEVLAKLSMGGRAIVLWRDRVILRNRNREAS